LAEGRRHKTSQKRQPAFEVVSAAAGKDMGMTVRVGLIGAGVMGADHAGTLASAVAGAALSAVSDADAARMDAIVARCGAQRTHADPRALIHAPEVDAVLIASPDETHAALVLECLSTGKPVLCEKPLAPSAAECLEIVARESALGRRLVQVGFMRRFDPGYLAMKRSLDARELGEPLLLHCTHRNRSAPPFFNSESPITNAAVHEIDIARWLLDREITSVTVVPSRSTSRARIRDPQLILLQTADGLLVDVEVFVNAQYGYDVRGELVCEAGTVALAAPGAVQLRASGTEGFRHAPDWRERFAEAYRAQLQGWIGAVRSGTPAGASAWDGYAATAVADACLASLRTGQPAEVSLAPRPALYA
jgi:myo-inositol 2-dehydrogenase / D-chiro-inositol 1-dehydrogenase